jgi:hypothetical protein
MQGQHDLWIEAAGVYTRLDERGRLHYWTQLSPEQQAALTAALNRQQPEPTVASSPKPVRKGGIFGVAAVGCFGFVFGAVATIVVQVVLLIAGVRSVMPTPPDLSESAAKLWLSDTDPLPEFCKEGIVFANAVEQSVCWQWVERHSEGGSRGP